MSWLVIGRVLRSWPLSMAPPLTLSKIEDDVMFAGSVQFGLGDMRVGNWRLRKLCDEAWLFGSLVRRIDRGSIFVGINGRSQPCTPSSPALFVVSVCESDALPPEAPWDPASLPCEKLRLSNRGGSSSSCCFSVITYGWHSYAWPVLSIEEKCSMRLLNLLICVCIKIYIGRSC